MKVFWTGKKLHFERKSKVNKPVAYGVVVSTEKGST